MSKEKSTNMTKSTNKIRKRGIKMSRLGLIETTKSLKQEKENLI